MPLYSLDGDKPETPAEGQWWLAPDAHVIGRVRLAAGVGIWFGAVLRGDNEWIEIGEGSNVQENTVCHTDPGRPLIVGKNCTVGHNVILHGCVIEDGCLVGMGAIVMNGAKIRKGSVIGAGAIVTEDKEFPENSLIIGAPAKAVRTLTPEQVAKLTRGAPRYVANGKRFKAGLKKIG